MMDSLLIFFLVVEKINFAHINVALCDPVHRADGGQSNFAFCTPSYLLDRQGKHWLSTSINFGKLKPVFHVTNF